MNVFIHIAQIGRWKEILDEQIEVVSQYLPGVKIFAGVLGEDSVPSCLEVCYQSKNLLEWEYPTLQKLYEHCQNNDGFVLYMHGKGSSEYKKCMENWREYLHFFIVEHAADCIQSLENYDICGCDWTGTHFFGNFWWARNDYIRKLKSPYDLASIIQLKNRPWSDKKVLVVHSEEKGYHYFDETKFYARHYRLFAEMWIGSKEDVKPYQIHKSNVMHLADEYPPKNYKILL